MAAGNHLTRFHDNNRLPMPDNTQSADSYRDALERTIPVEQFGAQSTRRLLEETVRDGTRVDGTEMTQKKTVADQDSKIQRADNEQTRELSELGDAPDVIPVILGHASPAGPRFVVGEELGRGATARVYVVRDNSLQRTVAVKLLRERRGGVQRVRERFVREAQVTALLEHPNILPVYDIGIAHNQAVYFATKQVSGVSLGDAIRAAATGEAVHEELRSPAGTVRTFLKVCDALAYAHAQGFIHQDVKPDNIMLGEYGETLLLDWGSSLAAAAPADGSPSPILGTPAYMSPEQARRERPDERSDVYALGASLFHALTGRHPMWADSPEQFWDNKKAGVIDKPTEEERRRAPGALLDIARKALQPDPSRRYQSMAAFAEDLKRYQAGLSVRAHRENIIEALYRWYRHHRRGFWLGAGTIVLVGALGTLFLREKIKELVTWTPVYQEHFDTAVDLSDSWRAFASTDWRSAAPEPLDSNGSWKAKDGALHGSTGQYISNCSFVQGRAGDLRVEWDVKGVQSGQNLNCFIGGETRFEGYAFHVGGFGNDQRVVLTKGSGDFHLEDRRLRAPLEAGRWYHLRMEKEGTAVRLYLDGRRVIAFEDPDARIDARKVTFGFEVNADNDVIIDNVRVWHHPLARKISPLAVPDRFFQEGDAHKARRLYREIAEAYPGTKIARTALFRAARCLHRLDSLEAAAKAYRDFEIAHAGSRLAPLARFERSRAVREMGDSLLAQRVRDSLLDLYPSSQFVDAAFTDMTIGAVAELDRQHRTMLEWQVPVPEFVSWVRRRCRTIQRWGETTGIPLEGNALLKRALDVLANPNVALPLDTLARLFPYQTDGLASLAASRLPVSELLRRFPEHEKLCAEKLVEVGGYREALRRYGHLRPVAARALLNLERYEEIIRNYPDQPSPYGLALYFLGQYREALELPAYKGDGVVRAYSLWRLGRAQEVLKRYPGQLGPVRSAAYSLGKPELYARAIPHTHAILNLSAAICVDMGNPDSAIALFNSPDFPRNDAYDYGVLHAYTEAGRLEELADTTVLSPHAHASALLWLGRTERILREYPENGVVRAMAFEEQGRVDDAVRVDPTLKSALALRRTGSIERLRARLPLRRKLHAELLLDRREYERIIEEYPDQRGACARALIALERYDEVLSDYPAHHSLCAAALIGLGRFEQARERFPEFREQYARYLLREKRYTELLEQYPDQATTCALALIATGSWARIPSLLPRCPQGRRGRHAILSAWALAEHARGNCRKADSLFRKRPPLYCSIENYLWFSEALLPPVLKALEGETGTLQRVCRHIAGNYRLVLGRHLWYDARFLLGEISEREYLDQPLAQWAGDRLLLLRGIRRELADSTVAAEQDYRRFLDLPIVRTRSHSPHHGPRHCAVTEQFVRWRLSELGAHR